MARPQVVHLEWHPVRGRRHGSTFLKLTLGEASTSNNQKQGIVNVCTFGDWMSKDERRKASVGACYRQNVVDHEAFAVAGALVASCRQ